MSQELIAVLLAGLDAAHSAVIAGIKRYRDQHRLNWTVRIVSPAQLHEVPSPAWWILRTVEHLNALEKTDPHLPICTLLGDNSRRNRTCTQFDDSQFGRLAAQHFHERGLKRVCTIDIAPRPRFIARRQGFVRGCQEFGLEYDHFVRPRHCSPDEADAQLVAWLHNHGLPLGVYAVIDSQAVWLRDMALQHGVRIPEELAILGTGDHSSTCIAREPELSSVAYPWALMGEAAAWHVHHQIQGAGPPKPQQLHPYRVVARCSTKATTPEDPLVRRSLQWLEQHLHSPHPMRDLLQELGVSDPTLCRHFRAALGSTPKQIHDRMRIDRAVELLTQDHLSLTTIAERCGFNSPTAFGVAFKRRRGCSPSAWRKAHGA